MSKQWILSSTALLSFAAMVGIGCTAQMDEATADDSVAAEAVADKALAETPNEDTATATDALTGQCYLDGCSSLHQGCTCSNTGWHGFCGVGKVHPGCVYCVCD